MRFQVSGGSVPGTEHTKPGKPGWTNNQDAMSWRRTDNCLVAVVCDGCGSGLHTEVGSNIAVQLLVEALANAGERYVEKVLAQPDTRIEVDWERVKTLVLGQITVLASAMGGSFTQVINDYFLFTMVGAVITPWNTFLFSVGDGVFVVNGEVMKLGPFPDNAPPYLAYNLTGSTLTGTNPKLLEIRIDRVIQTSELQSLLLGTDGVLDLIDAANEMIPHREDTVGGIQKLWFDDHFFENPDAIRRWLALVNREGAEIVGNKARITAGLLPDDTTLIVIRRDPNEKEEV